MTTDTSFSWFAYNANSALGGGAVYFDLWADSADFAHVQYSVGADSHVSGYAYRGRIPFHTILDAVGQVVEDTLWSSSGYDLGHVMLQAEQRGGQYHLEVYIPQPDSTSQLYYRFITTGSGQFDMWSSDSFGTSKIITAVPDAVTFPPITDYVQPDLDMSIVDSWACSPQVITVGNYYNEQVYVDVAGNTQNLGGTEGAISANSSHGPTRTGTVKPDVASPGDITMSAGPLVILTSLIATQPNKVDPDSLHMRNGGTSIASPVVAGSAALLLEKCPLATNITVRDAINGSAFADSFTGTLPNTEFGYGKINAFAALVSSNVSVHITGDTTVCAGDSVMLSGPAAMNSYLWTNGSTEQQSWTGADTLSLSVISSDGCAGSSDTLIITSLPLPVATITMAGPVLTSSPASSYQWFFENAAIPGADQQVWEAEVNGNYFVQVTDAQGCTANSDTVQVLSTEVSLLNAANDLRVWPVPVGDALHIEGLISTSGCNYQILDGSGRITLHGQLVGAMPVIIVEHLSSGVYVLRLIGAGSERDLRFVKH
ncbi:MAG: S8 family peptidase [Flavobacteriales bacterium]